MVAVYGMSEAIGPIAVSAAPDEVFISRQTTQLGHVSAGTLELVDRETTRLVRDAEETARQILDVNAEVLDGLANALVVQETLSGPALEVYLAAVQPWGNELVRLRGRLPENVQLRSNGSGPEEDTTSSTYETR